MLSQWENSDYIECKPTVGIKEAIYISTIVKASSYIYIWIENDVMKNKAMHCYNIIMENMVLIFILPRIEQMIKISINYDRMQKWKFGILLIW